MRFVFILDPDITYYRRVLKGVSLFARSNAGVDFRIDHIRTPSLFVELDQSGYDGLILGTALEQCEEASQLRTPTISVSSTHPQASIPRVVSDNPEAGRVVAQHLIDKGYRHFAFWGRENVVFSADRWTGFSDTLQQAGRPDFTVSHSTLQGRPFSEWLRRLPRPLGFMAMNDAMASDALETCHRLGLQIPQDVAVVGVDDDDLFSDLTKPPLSSVAQQTERIGFVAAESLLRLIQGEKIPMVTKIPIGPLVPRESSHTVAALDPLVAQAVQFMEDRLAHGVNVAELVRELQVSRRLLELRFRSALGRTPGRELARLKIERTRYLLATTNLPLKQVAMLSGFGNPVRMSQALRHYTGQTPMAYRRGFSPH